MTGTSAGQQPDGTRPGGPEPSIGADPPVGAGPAIPPPPVPDPDHPVSTVADPGPAAEISDHPTSPLGPPVTGEWVNRSEPDDRAETGTEDAEADAGGPGDGGPGDGGRLDAGSGIEPTTGAPINELPRRVPVRAPASSAWAPARPPREGQLTAVRPAIPEPAPPVDDEPAFWLPIEEVHWDGRPVDPDAAPPSDRSGAGGRSARRAVRAPKPPRRPVLGLAGLVVLSLLASFFAWVSAEPLWLAFGRGAPGTAIVDNCTGSGIDQRCRGEFIAVSGAFVVPDVRLAGVDAVHREPGSEVTAQMIDSTAGTAYVEAGAATRHLRWLLGLVLVLLCAAGVVWVTGAMRLPSGRIRRWGVLTGLAGPLLIAAGFLFAAF